MKAELYSKDHPFHHAARLREKMEGVLSELRELLASETDPKAQALFETSREVLTGLVKAYNDYEQRNEQAWR